MAVINQFSLSGIQNAQVSDGVKRLLAEQFWGWFDQNQEKVVYTVRVWIISKAIKVKELRPVFVLLFGERPL